MLIVIAVFLKNTVTLIVIVHGKNMVNLIKSFNMGKYKLTESPSVASLFIISLFKFVFREIY